MRVAFIDHYDSFSRNIISWLESADIVVDHYFFDALPPNFTAANPLPLIFSPGPGLPSDYHESAKLMQKSLGMVPILGICLGHQMLGEAADFSLKRSAIVWHGHSRDITITDKSGLFKEVPETLHVASYNSLCLENDEGSRSGFWNVSAINAIGEIEAIENWKTANRPAIGLQFHPESFLSQDLSGILNVWLDCVCQFRAEQ